MPDSSQLIYWDACCFTSYINGDVGRLPVLEAILDEVQADKGKSIIVTSVMSKVEVAFSLEEQTRRQLSPAEETRIAALWADTSVVRLIEFHELIADDAQRLVRMIMAQGLSLKAADAVHLATAMRYRASAFHTYDAKLLNPHYAAATQLTIMQPATDKPRLPQM